MAISSSSKRRRTRGTKEWKTEKKHCTYSTKLLDALRRVRPAPSSYLTRSRAVRLAADRALAISARGRTRWSRAILAGQALHHKSERPRAAAFPRRPVKSYSRALAMERSLPAVEIKAKVLGRLVPGCRKLAFPKLLEEASDYIAALEMQIRAMSALAELLSAGSTATAAPPSAGGAAFS